MKTVLEQGGIAPGGLNFDAKVRRESTALEDMFIAHILGMVSNTFIVLLCLLILVSFWYVSSSIIYSIISFKQDAFAKGLLGAAALLEDGVLPGMVSARYASYREGFGKKLAEGKATLEECEAYVMEHGEPTQISGGQEKYQSIFNTYT
jgi:xylose isomerase